MKLVDFSNPKVPALLGIGMGAELDAQVVRALCEQGFTFDDSQHAPGDKKPTQYVFDMPSASKYSQGFDWSVFVETDDAQKVFRLVCFLSRETSSLTGIDCLREHLMAALGQPKMVFDDVRDWMSRGSLRSNEDIAYMALWSPSSKPSLSAERLASLGSPVEFVELGQESFPGASAIASISASRDGAVAMLELFMPVAAAACIDRIKLMLNVRA